MFGSGFLRDVSLDKWFSYLVWCEGFYWSVTAFGWLILIFFSFVFSRFYVVGSIRSFLWTSVVVFYFFCRIFLLSFGFILGLFVWFSYFVISYCLVLLCFVDVYAFGLLRVALFVSVCIFFCVF